MLLLDLNPAHHSTILAALNHWYFTGDSSVHPEYFVEHEPLSKADVNALCERLNLGEDDPNELENNLVDLLTNTAMDCARDALGYSDRDDADRDLLAIAEAVRLTQTETTSDFDDRLYGMIHSQFRDVLTGLLVSGLEKPKPPELSALIATQPYDYEAEDSE